MALSQYPWQIKSQALPALKEIQRLSPAQIVVEAYQRLYTSKASAEATEHTQRLQSQYSLPDDAVLAIRLLSPFQLGFFVASEESHVAKRLTAEQSDGPREVLLPFISQLDASIPFILETLLDLDAQGAKWPILGPCTALSLQMLIAHEAGMCKPCSFLAKPGGCRNGESCTFCHYCDPGKEGIQEKKESRKRKRSQCDD